jgi:hypothetical protein
MATTREQRALADRAVAARNRAIDIAVAIDNENAEAERLIDEAVDAWKELVVAVNPDMRFNRCAVAMRALSEFRYA